MKPRLRAGLLITALAATLGAVYWAGNLEGGDQTVEAVDNPTPGGGRAGDARIARGPHQLDLDRLKRVPSLDPSADPFALRDFRPAPPVVKRPIAQPAAEVAPPPPPPPQAPPLPFSYLGKLAEGSKTTVFLSMGDRNLVVKPGDTIDNNYRVEEVTDSAVVLTYLPLSVKQTIPIGAK